ncbi:unnamed protein product [Haemonchus placei]|uniref:SAM-dependent methyltransferase n=1 Tax=Haemonchus placei TaxID=6290 RepID=A0A0N4WSB6_HAEPC|nr:unnamed protein product [Haemonchus placei]
MGRLVRDKGYDTASGLTTTEWAFREFGGFLPANRRHFKNQGWHFTFILTIYK